MKELTTPELEAKIAEYQAELERRKAAKPRPVLPEGYTMTENFAIYYRGQLIFSNATVEEEEVQALIYKFHAQNHGADFIIPQYEGMVGIIQVPAGDVEEVAERMNQIGWQARRLDLSEATPLKEIKEKSPGLYDATMAMAHYALSLAPKQQECPFVWGKLGEQEPPKDGRWVMFFVGPHKGFSVNLFWNGKKWSNAIQDTTDKRTKELYTHFAYLRNENE